MKEYRGSSYEQNSLETKNSVVVSLLPTRNLSRWRTCKDLRVLICRGEQSVLTE